MLPLSSNTNTTSDGGWLHSIHSSSFSFFDFSTKYSLVYLLKQKILLLVSVHGNADILQLMSADRGLSHYSPGEITSQVEVALEITSDQTVPDRSDLWSDEYALEDHCALEVRSKPPLIRRVPDRSDPWSDKFQTIVQTSSRPLSRLKCARNIVPD